MTSFAPEGFAPETDMNHARPADTPFWTESYAFWAYWKDRYFYMHFQRHPHDSSMWRTFVAVNGEDHEVIASICFGREISPLGPGNQQIHAICERPFESYRVEADTIGRVSDWDTLRTSVLPGLDDKIVPIKMDLVMTSVSETYSPLRGSSEGGNAAAKWTHYTPCKVHGYITIGDERQYIDTLGFRDHSAGPRTFQKLSSGFMHTGIFPSGRSYMAIGVGSIMDDGTTEFRSTGGVTIDGKLAYATEIEVDPGTISIPEPGADIGKIRFVTEEFGESVITMRATGQGVPFTNLPPCYQAIGLQCNPQDLIYHDWRVDIEWDGEKGIGGWEPCILTD